MPRRNEEPEWDTDEDEASSSGEESSFGDEGGEDDSSEEGSESGSDSNDGSERSEEEDEDDDSESEDEEDASKGRGRGAKSDESDDESGSDGSDDNSDEDEDDDDDDENPFADEEGQMKKGISSGSLMNEPGGYNPSWMRCVPAAIVEKGVGAAAAFCCVITFVPFLAIVLGLSLGLTGGDKDDVVDVSKVTEAPIVTPKVVESSAPSAVPVPITDAPSAATNSPTAAPVIKATTLDSDADTTIYRSGIKADTASGEEETMLVQNGPPGDDELPSAYSLVQFDGIIGVDSSDPSSIDAYLDSIEDLTVEFCLTVAADGENEDNVTYSTCLLPATPENDDIEGLTGAAAPDYNIPNDCVNGAVATFEVSPSTTNICIDVASLLRSTDSSSNSTISDVDADSTKEEDNARALRGRRSRRSLQNENSSAGYLFMIDNLEESDKPGTRFYARTDPGGRQPTLTVEGGNTCRTVVDIACRSPEFSTLCELVAKTELLDILQTTNQYDFTTVFAPTNDAFGRLAPEILEALNDPANIDALTNTLLYHIAPEKVMSEDLQCGLKLDMANSVPSIAVCGNNGTFYQVGNGISPGVNTLPKIVATDIETCHGVIHVVDEVLIPDTTDGNATCIGDQTQSIAEIACATPAFSMLCGLVTQAGLNEVLSGGLFTVFAPTNDALQKALQAFGQSINMTDSGFVTNVLLQHIVWGDAIYSTDLACDTEVQMANDEYNRIICKDDAFFIWGEGNDPNSLPGIDTPGMDACNGVIHIINELIIPRIGDANNSMNNEMDDFGPEFEPCRICGVGQSISKPAATIQIPESVGLMFEAGDVTCEMAEGFCGFGACSPETCAAFSEGISQPCGCEESNTVFDVLSSDDEYSSLLSFLSFAGLDVALMTIDGITLFAPTNDAFVTLGTDAPEVVFNLLTAEWNTHLQDLLFHHILYEELPSSDITNDLDKFSLNGEQITFTVNDDGTFVNSNSKVIAVDADASNGVVHTIDNVLLSSWIDTSIVDLAKEKTDLSDLVDLVVQADLAEILSGPGPYTVFAPTNDAFLEYFGEDMDTASLDNDMISYILTYHAVQGIYPDTAILGIVDGLVLETILGEDIVFKMEGDTATVNGKNIVSSNALANNGIVHVIDGVLTPTGTSVDENPDSSGDNAVMQQCSICSGEREDGFILKNPDAVISVPEGITLPDEEGMEETANTRTCGFVEEKCQTGYCDPEICAAFAEGDVREACGCEE